MNPLHIDGDLKEFKDFYHDGDVIVRGDVDILGNVAISGKLIVSSDISIEGDCDVEEISCTGKVDIAGCLKCNGLHSSSSINIGYGLVF